MNGHVAIGLNNGEMHVRAGCDNLGGNIAIKREAREWIEAMQYNP